MNEVNIGEMNEFNIGEIEEKSPSISLQPLKNKTVIRKKKKDVDIYIIISFNFT